ncbi:MAG: valine--tRNA ligase [Proteobacteria bacterium]|jgi:valyl-tRNA synthetase|nr:valine--tRNA ligase [Pseudomonadota bacterium]
MPKPLHGPLPKAYDPSAIEKPIYEFWERGGFFAAADTSDRPPYCIVIPPPNVTGALHMGHALTATIQDMLIRWRRMQGRNTLWLPGSDHAGIATQMVVERQLRKEGISRHDIGRERFVERVWQWKAQYGNRITEQHKRLGASVDWARERFTMDEVMSRAVREAFVRLYEEGRISRDNRLINWCVSCRTALSDVEVDRDKPEPGEMWSFAYPLADGDGEIVVATTRPETMLGDTAVAVHPDDPRYRGLIGRHVRHPFQDRTFPIVGDPILADPEKGTGAVKVTPAHDPNDFLCGSRNGLASIEIFDDAGVLNENGAPFAGLDRFVARERVKAALVDKGLHRGRADHEYAPGRCQRCRTVVEPKLSLQWFVDTREMATRAIEAARAGRTEFVPKHQEHRYYDWLEAKLPWCISRQLWWGHRIPAWYCECGAVTVSRQDPAACGACGATAIRQDEDVLDTWFSSALWPFSTLGWPEETRALETFYPTSVLETGYDIITFWVSRMMMMGLALMGDVPFRKVLLHPMVRDQDGNKMSKSRGNVIDPIDVMDGITLDAMIEKTRTLTLPQAEIESAIRYQKERFPGGFSECGTDALRFTLAAYTGQDQDIRFSVDRVEGYRKFCNKIWQATLGFAMPHFEGMTPVDGVPEPATLADRWILSRLAEVAEEVGRGLEEFRVGEATQALYHFFWDELCSWYIELQKPVLSGGDDAAREKGRQVLRHALDVSLRLLHPIMPFVTETLWQELPHPPGAPDSIMTARFPTAADGLLDPAACATAARLQEVINAVRAIRSEFALAPSRGISMIVRTDDAELAALISGSGALLAALARVESAAIIGADARRPPGSATGVIRGAELLVPLKGLIDLDAEAARLAKEKERAAKDIEIADKKLSNERFTAKAPAGVVAKERERKEEALARLAKIAEAIARLDEVRRA